MIIMLVLVFLDVNECDFSHGCEHRCINTEGSFKCACLQDGYRLGPDGSSCKGKLDDLTQFSCANIMQYSSFMH